MASIVVTCSRDLAPSPPAFAHSCFARIHALIDSSGTGCALNKLIHSCAGIDSLDACLRVWRGVLNFLSRSLARRPVEVRAAARDAIARLFTAPPVSSPIRVYRGQPSAALEAIEQVGDGCLHPANQLMLQPSNSGPAPWTLSCALSSIVLV